MVRKTFRDFTGVTDQLGTNQLVHQPANLPTNYSIYLNLHNSL